MHAFIDNADVQGLDTFIDKYSICGTESFEKFAKGLRADYNSVKFAILNRDVNNGMIEGFNDKIKLLRKIRYGRAKEELVNAVSVLSTQPRFRYSNYSGFVVTLKGRKIAA
jgi:transposase